MTWLLSMDVVFGDFILGLMGVGASSGLGLVDWFYVGHSWVIDGLCY